MQNLIRQRKKIAILLVTMLFAHLIFIHFTISAKAATVTFDTQGHGEQTFTQEIKFGSTVDCPRTLSDSLYVFNGWFTEPECINQYDFSKVVEDDVVLYASWIPSFTASSYYTVSFYTGFDDIVIDAQTVASGAYAKEPVMPMKDGAEFQGWYLDTSYNTAFHFSNVPVYSNFTLCAKWKLNTENEINDFVEEEENEEIVVEEATVETAPLEAGKTILDLDYWYDGIDADTYAQRIVDSCSTVPSTGAGYCASWVSYVYQDAGLGYLSGDAVDFWSYFGVSNKISDLKSGMIIAVPHSPTSLDGWRYGHTGIVVNTASGWMVVDSTGTVNITPLQKWIQTYDATNNVKWGWGHINPTERINWVGDIDSTIPFETHTSTPISTSQIVSVITTPESPTPTEPTTIPPIEESTTTEPETETPTEVVTEPETEEETEQETEKPTEPETEKETEPETEKETEPETEKETEKETEPATEKETEKKPIQETTEPETDKKTEKETQPEVQTEPEVLTDEFEITEVSDTTTSSAEQTTTASDVEVSTHTEETKQGLTSRNEVAEPSGESFTINEIQEAPPVETQQIVESSPAIEEPVVEEVIEADTAPPVIEEPVDAEVASEIIEP